MVNPSLWLPLAELADQYGFESVWLPEHLVLPVVGSGSPIQGDEHPPIPPHIPVHDVLVFLGSIAARTERIGLGTFVYNIGLRHPFSTARAIATLDVISGGRVEFGIGASWMAEEWDAAGLDFSSRGRRVDEAIEVCRRLWTDDVIEHHGEFFDFAEVMFNPKPVSSPVRLHIGGDGAAAMRRAATVGAGWAPMNHELAEIPAAVERLHEMCDRIGREDRPQVTVAGGVETEDDLDRYASHGIDRVLVAPWASSKTAMADTERFAEKLLRA